MLADAAEVWAARRQDIPALMDEERKIEERAADATEESRRRRGAEGETIQDEPEAGRLSENPDDDEPDMRT